MSTLFATSAMRAAVLDEAELAGLPARVQAIARSLALNQHVRGTFVNRFLNTLHDLLRRGTVEKIGQGRGVRWTLTPREPSLDLLNTRKIAGQSGVCHSPRPASEPRANKNLPRLPR